MYFNMSGKKGRSGRIPVKYRDNQLKVIQCIAAKTHQKLDEYLDYLLEQDTRDLTQQQVQQLITLHMKHSPDLHSEGGGNALDVLTKLALEGAKEYARVKAMRPIDLHTKVINDIDCEAEVEGDA